MKKHLFLILIIGAIFLLGSCRKAPKCVVNNMKEYGENGLIDEVKLKYVRIKDIKDSKMDNLMCKNIVLENGLDLSEVNRVYDLKCVYGESKTDYEKIKTECFESPVLNNWKQVNSELKGDEGSQLEYENKTLFVDKSGYIDWCSDAKFWSGASGIDAPYEVLDEKNIDLKKAYAMIGGKEELQKINARVIYLDAKLYDDYDIKPHLYKVHLSRVKNNNVLSLLYELKYNGIPLDIYTSKYKVINYTPKTIRTNNYCRAYIWEKGKIGLYSHDERIRIKQKKELKRILSFDSALEVVSRKFSGFSKIKVNEVKLVYLIEPQKQRKGDYYAKNGARVHLRPAYRFLIKKKRELSLEENMYYYINVDVQTGEIESNINEGN